MRQLKTWKSRSEGSNNDLLIATEQNLAFATHSSSTTVKEPNLPNDNAEEEARTTADRKADEADLEERAYYCDHANIWREVWQSGDGDGAVLDETYGDPTMGSYRFFRSPIEGIPKTTGLPKYAILDDLAMDQVCQSRLPLKKQRGQYWPYDFDKSGKVRSNRPNRGRPAFLTRTDDHERYHREPTREEVCWILVGESKRGNRYYLTGEKGGYMPQKSTSEQPGYLQHDAPPPEEVSGIDFTQGFDPISNPWHLVQELYDPIASCGRNNIDNNAQSTEYWHGYPELQDPLPVEDHSDSLFVPQSTSLDSSKPQTTRMQPIEPPMSGVHHIPSAPEPFNDHIVSIAAKSRSQQPTQQTTTSTYGHPNTPSESSRVKRKVETAFSPQREDPAVSMAYMQNKVRKLELTVCRLRLLMAKKDDLIITLRTNLRNKEKKKRMRNLGNTKWRPPTFEDVEDVEDEAAATGEATSIGDSLTNAEASTGLPII